MQQNLAITGRRLIAALGLLGERGEGLRASSTTGYGLPAKDHSS